MVNWVTIILVRAYFSADNSSLLHLKVHQIIYLQMMLIIHDVYIKDLVTGEIKLVSLDENMIINLIMM